MAIVNPQTLLYQRAATKARNTAGILTIKARDAEMLILKHLQEGLRCEPWKVKVINTPLDNAEDAQQTRQVSLRYDRTMFVNFISKTRLPIENALLTHECSMIQEATMTFGLRLYSVDRRGHTESLAVLDEAERILSGLILFPKTSVGPIYFVNDIFEDFDPETSCWSFVQTLEFAYRLHYDVRESELTIEDCC